MAITLPYSHPKGTKANLEALASSNGLIVGQVYYLTDEERLAVASSVSTFSLMAKQGEGGNGALDDVTITTGLTISNPLEWEATVLDFKNFNGFNTAQFRTYYEDGYSEFIMEMKSPTTPYSNNVLTVDGESGVFRFRNRPAWKVDVGGLPTDVAPWDSANLDIAKYALLASPAFTGVPTAPTAPTGTNTTQIATTEHVQVALSNQYGQIDQSFAKLANAALTGTPTAPTQTAGNNTTRIATTAFVTTAVGTKANSASPALTGTPTAPTATAGTNTTQLATTAFVTTAANAKASLTGAAFTGAISAPNHLTTMSGFCSGVTLPSEIVTGAIWPVAATVNSANCNAQALTAATASTVFTIKNKANGATVGTFTFAPGSTNASVSLSTTAVTAFNFLYIEAPATPDATLANISFLVRA